jgi:hypothetical protein
MSERPEIIEAIREVIRLNPQIKNARKQLRELENEQSEYRERLKERYGDNTVIKTSAGDITIRERVQDGRISLEDLRDLFETIDWVGDDTKERLIGKIEELCISKRKYSKTLTVRKTRRKQTRKHKDLKQDQ